MSMAKRRTDYNRPDIQRFFDDQAEKVVTSLQGFMRDAGLSLSSIRATDMRIIAQEWTAKTVDDAEFVALYDEDGPLGSRIVRLIEVRQLQEARNATRPDSDRREG